MLLCQDMKKSGVILTPEAPLTLYSESSALGKLFTNEHEVEQDHKVESIKISTLPRHIEQVHLSPMVFTFTRLC